MNEIGILIKGTQRASSPSYSYARIQREDDSLQSKREYSPEPKHAGPSISDFQPPEL